MVYLNSLIGSRLDAQALPARVGQHNHSLILRRIRELSIVLPANVDAGPTVNLSDFQGDAKVRGCGVEKTDHIRPQK